MTPSQRFSGRRLPDTLRSRLEVTTALAWEALVDAHVAQAVAFVKLLEDRAPFEESLPRYLMEVDVGDSTATAIRTRALVMFENTEDDPEPEPGALELRHPDAERIEAAPAGSDSDEQGWRRFRPDVMMREMRERQRREDETETWIRLALARAEEAVIATHVDNALMFAALLGDAMPLDRGVQEYIDAVNLSGGRAQTVHQRTMARLADVHLPQTAPRN
jgi:hypothetical protein